MIYSNIACTRQKFALFFLTGGKSGFSLKRPCSKLFRIFRICRHGEVHTGAGRNDDEGSLSKHGSRWQGARRQYQGPMPCPLARPAPQTLHTRCVSAPRRATDVAQALRFGASPLVRATALPAPAAAGAESGARCLRTRQTRRASCPRPRSAQLRGSRARPDRARTRNRWARASAWVIISRSSATPPSALPSRAW